MGATSSEGTGHGSAERSLRGFDLDKLPKVLIGPLNALRSCIELVGDSYRLRIGSSDVSVDDSGFTYTAETVQEALDELSATTFTATNALTYRQGATSSGSIYGTWEELYAAFQNTDGQIRILLDASITFPLTIPAGTYDFEYRAVFNGGPVADLSDNGNIIHSEDGTLIKNLNRFEEVIRWQHNGTSHIFEYDEPFSYVLMEIGCIFFNFAGPLFKVQDGQLLQVGLINSSGIFSSVPSFDIDPTGELRVSLRLGSILSNNPFGGGGTSAILEVDDSSVNAPGDVSTNFPSYVGSGLAIERFGFKELAFTNADLVANVLTFDHDLNAKHVIIQIVNDSDELVSVGTFTTTLVDTDTVTVDFGAPITGTWTITARR